MSNGINPSQIVPGIQNYGVPAAGQAPQSTDGSSTSGLGTDALGSASQNGSPDISQILQIIMSLLEQILGQSGQGQSGSQQPSNDQPGAQQPASTQAPSQPPAGTQPAAQQPANTQRSSQQSPSAQPSYQQFSSVDSGSQQTSSGASGSSQAQTGWVTSADGSSTSSGTTAGSASTGSARGAGSTDNTGSLSGKNTASGASGSGVTSSDGTPLPATLTASNVQASNTNSVGQAPQDYSYSPSVIQNKDGSRDMYWGGGSLASGGSNPDPGDAIFTAHAPPGGGFGEPSIAFKPSQIGGTGNDGQPLTDAADPSVLDADGQRLLYFSTAGTSGSHTGLGAATQQADGSFKPMELGSLVKNSALDAGAAGAKDNNSNQYGRGQPSVTYDGQYYYMSATDTTGAGGEGAYLFRSKGADFADGQTDTLGNNGWEPLTQENSGQKTFFPGDAVDLARDPQSGNFLAASNGTDQTTIRFFSPDFTQETSAPVSIPNQNTEEPGFLRSGAGELANGLSDISIFRSTGNNAAYGQSVAPNDIQELTFSLQ